MPEFKKEDILHLETIKSVTATKQMFCVSLKISGKVSLSGETEPEKRKKVRTGTESWCKFWIDKFYLNIIYELILLLHWMKE